MSKEFQDFVSERSLSSEWRTRWTVARAMMKQRKLVSEIVRCNRTLVDGWGRMREVGLKVEVVGGKVEWSELISD